MPSQRDASRQNWISSQNTIEEINAGSLQSIADATELMAKNHAELIADRDRYRSMYQDYRAGYDAQVRSIRAYKAHNTRLRNQLSQISRADTREGENSRSQIDKADNA